MKRNMDLIRLQLFELEGSTDNDLSGYSEDERVYNSALAIEAGLVDGRIIKGQDGEPKGTICIKLTWAGHDFLDAARNDELWKKAQKTSKSKGLELTFDLLKELLVSLMKTQLSFQ